MPQFASPLTINDSALLAVVYSVEKLSSESSVLVDRRKTTREAQPSLTVNFDRATPARKTFKVNHVVAYPLVRTINGVDLVTDTARAKVEFIIPQGATDTERKNLRAMVANGLATAMLQAGIDDLDPLY